MGAFEAAGGDDGEARVVVAMVSSEASVLVGFVVVVVAAEVDVDNEDEVDEAVDVASMWKGRLSG